MEATSTSGSSTARQILDLKALRKPLWIFNGYMIWAAVLSCAMFAYGDRFLKTMHHKGPGIIFGPDGDQRGKVSESEYKRRNLGSNGVMLVLAVGLWVTVAWTASREKVHLLAQRQYLECEIDTLTAYHAAFYCALDEESRKQAAREAEKSEQYLAAKAITMRASRYTVGADV